MTMNNTIRSASVAALLAVACLPQTMLAQATIDVTNETAIEQMANQSFTNFKNNKWHNFGDHWASDDHLQLCQSHGGK